MINTVFIDIDNTLLDFNRCAAYSMAEAYKEKGVVFEEYMFREFKIINDSLWLKIEKGELTKAQLHAVRWNMIFQKLGFDFDGPAFEERFRFFLNQSCVKVDGADSALQYLSGRYTVCVASNGPEGQQVNRLKSAGMLPFINKVFTSEKIGYPKPSKEFFDACFSQLPGVSPEDCVMIGDSLTADIAGGAKYGMKTLWFNFAKEALSGETVPNYTVDSLDDIKNYL